MRDLLSWAQDGAIQGFLTVRPLKGQFLADSSPVKYRWPLKRTSGSGWVSGLDDGMMVVVMVVMMVMMVTMICQLDTSQSHWGRRISVEKMPS